MIISIPVKKDTYITDRNTKFNNGALANLGRASTIDIFKLYEENKYSTCTTKVKLNDNSVDDIELHIKTQSSDITFKFVLLNQDNFVFGKNDLNSDIISIPILNNAGTRLSAREILENTANVINSINEVLQDGPGGNKTVDYNAFYDNENITLYIKTTKKQNETPTISSNNNLVVVEDFYCVEKSFGLLQTDIDSFIEKNSINSEKIELCNLSLKSVSLGNTIPEDSEISCKELKKLFVEGYGKDVNSLSDTDVTNFVNINKNEEYTVSGELIEGIEVSGEINSSKILPHEDLLLDVTDNIKSFVDRKNIDNTEEHFGFSVGLTNEIISNTFTYFVSRFASRHVSNKSLRPTLDLYVKDKNKKSLVYYFDKESHITFSNQGVYKFFDDNNDQYNIFLKVYYKKFNDETLSYDDVILLDQRMEKSLDVFGNTIENEVEVTLPKETVSRYDLEINKLILNEQLSIIHEIYGTIDGESIILNSNTEIYEVLTKTKNLSNLTYNFSFSSRDNILAANQVENLSLVFIDRKKKYAANRKKIDITSEYVGEIFYYVKSLSTGKEFYKIKNNSTKLFFDGEKYVFDFYCSEFLKDDELEFVFYIVDENNIENLLKDNSFKVRFK
jgi:hypothetical protein